MSLKTITITLLAASCPVWAAESTVKVSLHPAATAIAPGARFDVGIRFDVPEGWHIYWKNPGDAGMPPRVDWKLPPGFQVGVLRFPAPKVHVDPGNLVTNVLDGETVLLQSLVAPEDLEPGRSVTLAADVHWMVRNKRGVEETAAVSVKLPVGEPTSDLDPRHQAVLQRARRALPIPADRGKHVKVTPSVAVQTVRPGQTFEVVFEVAVPTGTHIQSNRPPIKAFIATHVFIEPDPGLDFGNVKYPRPQEHTHPQLGRLSEYRGKVKIRVPVEVREDAEGEHVRIAGILTSQACNDRTGTCYPPEHVAWALAVPLDRSGAAPLVSEVTQSDETATEAETPVQTGGEQFEGILARLGLPGLLLGCFLYGLFINATPCVLPLLSIKVL